ncbi:MAG: toprim domain-containing protein [Thermodesulfovibrionales bacterium]|jgi:DNA primase
MGNGSDFQTIKDRLSLLEVISQEAGLGMKGAHLEECPFCGGHGCFSLHGSNNDQFKCHQCSEAGDVIDFFRLFLKVEAGEALKLAADKAGIALKAPAKRDPAGLNLTVKDTIFLEAVRHYTGNVPLNGGKSYLMEGRGHQEETISRMQVGWSTGGLVDHLRAKGFSDEQIKASGLGKEKESEGRPHLVDFFRKGLAIFPHMDRGRVLHFTMKDPSKKLGYQLPNEARSREWRFYHQEALSKYGEVLVVEGENDLLSVMDSGVDHVIGLIGQPAEYQLKALQTFCAAKQLYLWLDNDKGGKNFVRLICATVRTNIRIIRYSEEVKDPDEYLRGFEGDRKKEIKRLQEEAVDYLTWEIGEIATLETLEERLKALKVRKVFTAMAEMVEAEKQVFVEKVQRLGFSKEAIEEQIDTNQDLRHELAVYFETVPKKDCDPNYVASLIFKHLGRDGRFFRDGMANTFLLYHHQIYEIGSNRPFNALIKKMTGLLPTKEPGRSVWESLASEAYNAGMRIDLASWISTDRVNDTIYINLNSPNNGIIKINKDKIEEIPNGLNKEGVLLRSSNKIMPLNFLPDADIAEGMKALQELVFENLTCDRKQRYLILLWMFSAFLLDFSPYMALMKFSGASASGKTTAARLLSLLIYGNEHLGDPSAAAAYAVAAQNPLLIIDNLEHDDFTKNILKFLLLSATKGSKEKRTQGTDSETIQESPKALVLITAIEPFVKAELINRTYDIEFSGQYKSDGFVEDEAIREVLKKRDLILSAMLKFISREILPNLEKRKDYITILKKEYKNHSKNRTDEYLSLLMLMLEKVLKYIPLYGPDDFLYGIETGDKEIRKAWIEYQNAQAKEMETSSNNIIKLLDGLVQEYVLKMKDLQPAFHQGYDEEVYCYTHPEYGLELVKTKAEVSRDEASGENYTVAHIEFVTTSKELVPAFDRFCKNNGIKNPYPNAAVFGERFKNDRPLLTKSGWELLYKEGIEPYHKIVRGYKFWKFRKTIIR